MSIIIEVVFSDMGSCKTRKPNGFLKDKSSVDFELSEVGFDFRLKIFYPIISICYWKEINHYINLFKLPKKYLEIDITK